MTEGVQDLQILLTPEQSQALTTIAQGKDQTIFELVEQIFQEAIDRKQPTQSQELQQQLEALERVKLHKAKMLTERGGKPLSINLPAVLQEIREERDEYNVNSLVTHRH
ncbi:MAG TPA: hypothetical protein G4N96_00815 [Chloroflexi bacterium]|nr:MAG: hypothetical protein B6243_02745 [Anaerolineaceae bacterium 4572_5.2]HEY83642.1 hypothetical protein [Chloroflexota bacterium]